jgi:uncharacterized protein YjaG (DUF416 family)
MHAMNTFDEIGLVSRLTELPKPLRLAFAVACASRMARPYRAGQDHLILGAPAIVDDTLNRIWDFAVGGPAADWARTERDLTALIPDGDDQLGPAHFIVDDALAATAYAVRTAVAGDAQEAAFCSRRAYEAVDQFAQRTITATSLDADVERTLLADPVVQAELSRQARDLATLEQVTEGAESAAITALRSSAASEDLIPLDDLNTWLSGAS